MSTAVLERGSDSRVDNVLAFPGVRRDERGERIIRPALASTPTTALGGAIVDRSAAEARTAPSRGSGKLRLTRRGRVVFTLLAAVPLVFAVVAFGLNAGGARASSELSAADFSYVTVESGETLWGLAVALDPTADPRDLISEIKDLNGLSTSALQAGTQLAIPLRFDAP